MCHHMHAGHAFSTDICHHQALYWVNTRDAVLWNLLFGYGPIQSSDESISCLPHCEEETGINRYVQGNIRPDFNIVFLNVLICNKYIHRYKCTELLFVKIIVSDARLAPLSLIPNPAIWIRIGAISDPSIGIGASLVNVGLTWWTQRVQGCHMGLSHSFPLPSTLNHQK